jgi:predicted double-glycine peptidase
MIARLSCGLAVFLLAGCAAQPVSGPHFLAGGAPVGDFRLPVTSVQEMRFAGVIRQQFDFSCGSAALATLLRFHYNFDVREDNAFRGMWASGDRAQIRNVGFSLLDMKRWLGTRGLSADGYEVTLDQIAETGLPGIALIAVKNYRHFVVVKGVSETEVLLGDPSVGIVIMPREEFQQAWNGIYFALADDPEIARRNFNSGQQWAAFARAPVGNRLTDPVSQQALMLTAPFFGDIS